MTLATDLYGPGHVMCCICFEVREDSSFEWHVDSEGVIWDVCRGDCARQAYGTEGEDNA